MKQLMVAFLATSFTVFIISCNSRNGLIANVRSDKFAGEADDDSIVVNDLAGKLPAQRFIRTGELKLKVENVAETIEAIETQTRKFNGYISNSSFNTVKTDSSIIHFSADSNLQSIHYAVNGIIILKIPDDALDSMMRFSQSLGIFLEYRNITAEDVSLRLLSNSWTAKLNEKSSHQIHQDIHSHPNKLNEEIQAEQIIKSNSESENLAKLSSLMFDREVSFSTVSINVYQEPIVQNRVLATEKQVSTYKTPFIGRMVDAAGEGFNDILDVLVVFARIWILIPIVLAVLLLMKKYRFYYFKMSTLKSNTNAASK